MKDISCVNLAFHSWGVQGLYGFMDSEKVHKVDVVQYKGKAPIKREDDVRIPEKERDRRLRAMDNQSINPSFGSYAEGRLASPTLRCQPWRSPQTSLYASPLPIPSNSQQEALTCLSPFQWIMKGHNVSTGSNEVGVSDLKEHKQSRQRRSFLWEQKPRILQWSMDIVV